MQLSKSQRFRRRDFAAVSLTLALSLLFGGHPSLFAEELSRGAVLKAIEQGQQYLISAQLRDGSFAKNAGNSVGLNSLITLALLSSGKSAKDPQVERSLKYLRSIQLIDVDATYDASLLIMALAAAQDPDRGDRGRIAMLAEQLIAWQSPSGGWSYGKSSRGGHDNSNSQYAMLGLREAADYGIDIPQEVWEKAKGYWVQLQNHDGGWSYGMGAETGRGSSTGSMTVAGISSLAIVDRMLYSDGKVKPDGQAPCCEPLIGMPEIERGAQWLGRNFSVKHNPGGGGWLLYYLYGLERAGRLSGRRFFGDRDWYREGAQFLLSIQLADSGGWQEGGHGNDGKGGRLIGTSFSLLFLSKGLSPVLISKLKYEGEKPAAGAEDWNYHPRDARNLVEYLSGLPRWPKLMSVQELDLTRAGQNGDVDAVAEGGVLYLTGKACPKLSDQEVLLLREAIQRGTFLMIAPTCTSKDFEAGVKDLVSRLFPQDEGELKPLSADHPVYRAEFLLSPETIKLWGVEAGCRTPVIYCPEDLGCYWEYWRKSEPPKRLAALKARVLRATQIGANIVAYATGREPPDKLQIQELAGSKRREEHIERGLLQIAKLRHGGDWNAAPQALRNLLFALNEAMGVTASTRPYIATGIDETLFDYPLMYLHGRLPFEFAEPQLEIIRKSLTRGGLLFADACCGAPRFDESIRAMAKKLFPEAELKRIPLDHEIFSEAMAHDIRRLRRRSNGTGANQTLQGRVAEAETYLEGIEIDGRLVFVYSKYDVSCALEKQNSLSCEGYTTEDAVKLATNVVMYSLQQDIRFLGTPSQ